MLHDWQLHKDYQNDLQQKLIIHLQIERNRIKSLDKAINKLYLLYLGNLLSIVKPLYTNCGRPAKNQQGIIRSPILMLDLRKYSITKWTLRVRNDLLLFDICGFDSIHAPSVVSYYDLLIHLWMASHKQHVSRKLKLKRFESKPKKRLKANQKLPNKRQGIVKRLVKKTIKDKLPDFRPKKILQKFLACCVVDTSAKMGLLGDIESLSVDFDASPYCSKASHYGVKVCDCRSKGIYNCTCLRQYSDPDARWGWDSYHERWFFGSTLFNITASDSSNDLPIYLRMVQANQHNSVTTVFALRDIFNLYSNMKFKNFILDGAMDNYPTYEPLSLYDMIPFIPLNSRTKAK